MIKWKISILAPGDHIRVKRDRYYHHGIYVGNNEVVHFTAESNDGINDKNGVLVRKTSIEFFLKNGVAEKATYTGKQGKNLKKPIDIVELANNSIGESGYNLIFNNCEDFVHRTIFNKDKYKSVNFNFLHFLGRLFLKGTGVLPFLLLIKPKCYYESLKAKKECRDIKGGAIIISNHSSTFDYFVLMMRYLGTTIHTMVGEAIYRFKSLAHLCIVMENISIDRKDPANIHAFIEAKEYLKSRKSILIFPEGKFEDNPGVIEDIKPSAIYLAFETNKPIIPYFIDGNYSLIKRNRLIAGEKIYIRDLIQKDHLEDDDIEFIKDYIVKKFRKLKHQLNAYKIHKTKDLFAKKLAFLDICRFSSIPFGYIFFWGKKHYVGDKNKIKNAMKERVLLAPNHTSMFDVPFVYMHFLSRRPRILTLDTVVKAPVVGWLMRHGGIIIYNRESSGGFDLKSFKETDGILEANGFVVMFPQGHIADDKSVVGDMKPGLAMHSLRTGAPVVPMVFSRITGPFRFVHMVLGDPIYPNDYIVECQLPSVEKYTEIITNKMFELEQISKKYSKKGK